jgi:hypothetical protein
VIVLAVFVAAAFRLGPLQTEYAEVLTAGLSAIGLSTLMTSWIGAIGWAFYTGFVENDQGQLTLTQGDLTRLLLFVLATLAIGAITRRSYNFAKENAHD